jgi:hypothetical protein
MMTLLETHFLERIRMATIKEQVMYGMKSKALLYFSVRSEQHMCPCDDIKENIGQQGHQTIPRVVRTEQELMDAISVALGQRNPLRLPAPFGRVSGPQALPDRRRPPAQAALITVSSPVDPSTFLISTYYPCFSSQGRHYSLFGSYQA